MATTKRKKTARKSTKKLDAFRVRVRDLEAKKGKVVGGGLIGGGGGLSGRIIKKTI